MLIRGELLYDRGIIMIVSKNVLSKLQKFYDDKHYDDLCGEERIDGYLEACVDFGFMTAEDAQALYNKLFGGERIYELQPSK